MANDFKKDREEKALNELRQAARSGTFQNKRDACKAYSEITGTSVIETMQLMEYYKRK